MVLFEELLEGMENVAVGMSAFSTFTNLVSIAAYVLMSLALYTIANRRQINNPWLAWIPIGNVWLLGCISDHYRYVSKGITANRRKTLLTLTLVDIGLVFLMVIGLIIGVAIAAGSSSVSSGVGVGVAVVLFAVLIVLAVIGVSIALTVLEYICYADIFESCDPAQKTLFTVLSIVCSLIGLGIVTSVLFFIVRDRELGLPPRTTV